SLLSMSSIYVLEPPTNGRVLLQTTVGNIDIELWSKEAPKACRNFLQLCMEGYYDDTLFHRVVKDFIVQGGDPTGTGEGGDSAFGKPFGLELHSRLRFNRRGLVGMACLQPGQNGSQFFFTLAATPELEKHNTIFGQVVGNSLFNMLRLAECETDQQERPLNPQRIISARVIDNPYPDLAPREEQLELRRRRQQEQQLKQQEESEAAKSGFGYKRKKLPKSEAKATRNLALLSFGDEAEEIEEEQEADGEAQDKKKKKQKKIMSSHDLLDDPRLSSETAPILPVETQATADADSTAATPAASSAADSAAPATASSAAEDETRDSRLAKLKLEVAKMRRALHKTAAPTISPEVNAAPVADRTSSNTADDDDKPSSMIRLKRRRHPGTEELGVDRAAAVSREDAKAAREAATLKMFAKFAARLAKNDGEEDDDDKGRDDDVKKDASSSLFSHVFQPESGPSARRVLDPADAATASAPDRYELEDPRNPMNKRRRKAAAEKLAARIGRGGSGGGDDRL
ncbi:hypothetical protein BOX15_Mlig007823g3, partial [Macrostomum lignano]